MSNINCLNNCPWADQDEDCHGECRVKPKPADVLNDADLERGASPRLTVIDQDYVQNGGW